MQITTKKLSNCINACLGATLITLITVSKSNAAQVAFQSDGTDPSIFTDLMITGNVQFNTPFAKVFGRTTTLDLLPAPERLVNDFRGTLAENEFLAAPQEEHESIGILFALNALDNPNYPTDLNEFAGIKWRVSIPEQIGLTNRRIHVQFGAGKLAGGPAAIGGGLAVNNGRKAVFKLPSTQEGEFKKIKDWGQWLTQEKGRQGETPEEAKARVRRRLEQIVERKKKTNANDPRIPLYLALLDGSKRVDPIESFYIDLLNDNGSAFDVELEVLLASEFESLAQFLNQITVEVGEQSEFPEVYDDTINNAFIGTVPLTLDLNVPGDGEGGIPYIQVGSADLETVPEPSSTLSLLSLGILGVGATLKRKVKRINSIEKEPTKIG